MLWTEHIIGIHRYHRRRARERQVLAVCNHVNGEWMPRYRAAASRGSEGSAVMKEALKYVPIANAGIREGFITVKRGQGKAGRKSILESFRSQGARLCADNVPMWLVIFPEGTWIFPGEDGVKIQASSNGYARKAGYDTPLRNVLFPRAHGFVALWKACGTDQPIDAVYDITMAYNKPTIRAK